MLIPGPPHAPLHICPGMPPFPGMILRNTKHNISLALIVSTVSRRPLYQMLIVWRSPRTLINDFISYSLRFTSCILVPFVARAPCEQFRYPGSLCALRVGDPGIKLEYIGSCALALGKLMIIQSRIVRVWPCNISLSYIQNVGRISYPFV